MNLLQQTVYKSRYARFLDGEKRREHWNETVARYIEFIEKQVIKQGSKLTGQEAIDLYDAIFDMKTMPSMRLMMTAGLAVERDNIAAYNCAYTPIDSKRTFAEILYILMNGTGVGFSVERQYVNKLPLVPNELNPVSDTIVVQDSKLGWAKAYNKLINSLYEGDIPNVDYSKLRPAGARLRTFGGRSSGPAPLQRLFQFTVESFKRSTGRRLSSIEVHDIACTIGEVVVVGGVRRSALISLSNLTDRRMREAKVGAWWEDNKQRALANNSVCYTEKPDAETFLEEWTSLVKSKSGERGIFNRVAAQSQAAKYGRRDGGVDYGCNPCSEILLRPRQFCNLTEAICRKEDTFETLAEKVRVAAILGTIQSTLTDFTFLSEEWKRNCEEERLLGVSLTGIFDNALLTSKEAPAVLEKLREVAVTTNKEWAARLGISQSAAITTVKPSGTVSQLVDSSSGIHPRFSPYYIRNVRMDTKDPICKFLIEQGVVNEPDVVHPETQTVFSFPVASPESSEDMAAIQHLELWKVYQDHWCEHKPSITVLCEDKEWPEVGGWVYKHFDQISGVAFLPKSDHTYKQAPYIAISKEQYEELKAKTPTSVDWSKLIEEEDKTTASQELACAGNVCEII